MAEYYRAREAFAAPVGNSMQVIQPGHLVSDADPLFQRHREQFVPVADFVERTTPTVEATTAAPGEKRQLSPLTTRGPKPRKDTTDATPPAT